MSDVENNTEEPEIDQRLEDIKAAFTAGYDAELDEDSVKLEMIHAGAKFAEVTRLYNLFLVQFGYVKSKEEKNKVLDEVLSDEELTEESTFDKCSQLIMEQLEVSEKSANAMIRQWATKREIEYFKKPKAEKSEQSNFDTRLYAWIISNVDATVEQFTAHLEEVGTDNSLRFKPKHIALFNFAQSIKAKYAA
jgi:hypothetical protein